MSNIFNLPNIGFGAGLRTKHYSHILENKPNIDWFEIISENFMDNEGRPKRILEKILQDYKVVMHGVSLSIGSTDEINFDYLKSLKKLINFVKPPWISDHLCWTGINKKNTHDLLPVPYTEEALKHIVERIKIVQDFLERPILLENPSTYLEFKDSQMSEADFIKEMAVQANCALLLDANNIYVTCYNHQLDAKKYIDSLPLDRVVQIHLAGHTNNGNHIVDTHDDHVTDEVWKLYSYIIQKRGATSTMVEWDDNIPEFSVLQAEVEKAKKHAKNTEQADLFKKENKLAQSNIEKRPYKEILSPLQNSILAGDKNKYNPENWIIQKEDFAQTEQINVYIEGYALRLKDILKDDFPTTCFYLGEEKALELYIKSTPSTNTDISKYCLKFPEFIANSNLENKEFLTELAQLELEIAQIFSKSQEPSLDPTKVEGANLTNLKPKKHARILEFSYDVNYCLQSYLENKKTIKIEPKQSFLIIYNHDNQTCRLPLEKAEYILLKELEKSGNLSASLEKLIEDKIIPVEEIGSKINEIFSKFSANNILANL